MKLVKSWEVLGLFNQRVLEEIAAQHNLRSLVSKVILSIEILTDINNILSFDNRKRS